MSSVPVPNQHVAAISSADPWMTPGQITGMVWGLGLASWMEFYTFDAVNLVLPDMKGSFGVSQDEASWILTAFSTAMFLGVPLSIWLAERLGYLRYIIGSSIIFAIASLGCAFSGNLQTMLLWRTVQGFAGAGLAMWWRAGVYLIVPRPQRSNSMMRISVMLYIASAVGLLYSGYVTDNLDWRLIFLPKIVFVVAAVWLLCRYFPNMPAPTNPRAAGTDKAGIVFLGLSLACMQIVLSRGEIDDWFGSSQIQSLTWISLIAMILFIGWQFHPRNKVRLLAVDLFGHRNVLASVILGVLTGIILSGSIFALPEFLRHVDPRELNATDTGRILCAYAFTAAAIRPLVTRAIPKFGQRKVLTFSLVMLIASMLIFARLITLGTPEVYYIAPLILYAFCLVPLLGAVGSGTAARMPQDQQLDAVSIYMTFRQFGTALGVTLISVLLDRREEFHSSRLFEHLHATGSQVYAWVGTATHAISYRAGVPTIQAHEMAMKLLGDEGARQAATLAYADSFLFMAGIGVLALCCVPLMSPTPVVTK